VKVAQPASPPVKVARPVSLPRPLAVVALT
jgi:hypothetical protein